MEKEFCTYTQALRLKAIGFDEPCMAIYYSKNKSFSWHHHKDHTNDEPALESGEFNISAPLKSQAFRWFRETHDLACYIYRTNFTSYEWVIDIDESYAQDLELDYTSYEKAELACLNKLLEIVEFKKK